MSPRSKQWLYNNILRITDITCGHRSGSVPAKLIVYYKLKPKLIVLKTIRLSSKEFYKYHDVIELRRLIANIIEDNRKNI